MKRCAVLFGLLWAMLLALPFGLRAQQESPFKKLWEDFDRGSSYWYKNKSLKLDTIEQLALSERKAYQHFRANWERTIDCWKVTAWNMCQHSWKSVKK